MPRTQLPPSLERPLSLMRVDFAPAHRQPPAASRQPPAVGAVAVLMIMHLAIALVTYNCLVYIAEVKPPAPTTRPASETAPGVRRSRPR